MICFTNVSSMSDMASGSQLASVVADVRWYNSGIVFLFWLLVNIRAFPLSITFVFPFSATINYLGDRWTWAKQILNVVLIHPGPRVINNPVATQRCSHDPDCIWLICLPLSILTLIDMKHSLTLMALLLINYAALSITLSSAYSISKRLGSRSCRLTLIGFSFADSELQDGSQG